MMSEQNEYITPLGHLTDKSLELQRVALGGVLKQIRCNTGVSRNNVAKSTGLHNLTIKAIEDGMDNYTIDNLTRYITYLGININLTVNKK